MDTFLGNIYCWFESLFGQNLAEHLWGWNCETQDFSGINLFNSIGLITICLALLFVLLYYYLPIRGFNHPRTNRWWNWIIILLVVGLTNLFIGYGWIVNDYLNGNIGDCLVYTRNENGEIIAQHIFERNCWLFGVVNLFVSTIFFFVFTLILKWWSRNCKHSPMF